MRTHTLLPQTPGILPTPLTLRFLGSSHAWAQYHRGCRTCHDHFHPLNTTPCDVFRSQTMITGDVMNPAIYAVREKEKYVDETAPRMFVVLIAESFLTSWVLTIRYFPSSLVDYLCVPFKGRAPTGCTLDWVYGGILYESFTTNQFSFSTA